MTDPSRLRRGALAALPLLVFVAIAALLYARLGGDAAKLPSALIGEPAPPLPKAGLNGPLEGADASLRKGQVTVVNIFGSWCEPCRYEHPALLALADTSDVKTGKVALIGIAQKDSAENVRRFLNAEGDPYSRVTLDTNGRTGIDWGVYGVPETFVVRGDGTIAYKFVGPMSQETMQTVLLPQIRKAEG